MDCFYSYLKFWLFLPAIIYRRISCIFEEVDCVGDICALFGLQCHAMDSIQYYSKRCAKVILQNIHKITSKYIFEFFFHDFKF